MTNPVTHVLRSAAPFPTALAIACFPVIATAQSAHSNMDCTHVTIRGSVQNNADSGVIDWLALTDQADPHGASAKTSDGCLVDTTGVGVNRIVQTDENGLQIMQLIDGETKIHQAGGSTGGVKDRESQRITPEEDYARLDWKSAIANQPPLAKLLFTLVPLSVLAGLAYFLFTLFRTVSKTSARRFTCKIPATIEVDDRMFSGRITRMGPASCQFALDKNDDANTIAGMLMRSDVPDFDLNIGGMSFAIVPETPGSRFTSLFLVKPMSPAVLDNLKEKSETPARKERKRPVVKSSVHRDRLRASRLRRMQTA